MILVKRMLYFSISTIFVLLIFLGASYTTAKSSNNDTKLKKQITLLQSQLKEKANVIKKLQKENQDLKKQISEFPKEIAKAKAMVAASQAKSVPESYFSGFQVSIKQMIIDGKDCTPNANMNKFVCGYRYSDKYLENKNIYIPVDVVGEILNKPFEWDSQNKILYFGEKSVENGVKQGE